MKNIINSISLLALVLIVATSCNKTEKVSDNFISAGDWTITELSVDGTNEAELPEWEIKACDIYAASCEGHWKNDEGGETEFIWQFREKGKTFEISHQGAEAEESDDDHDDHDHDHDHAGMEVAVQAYNFSGVYEVLECSKDAMKFQSTAALGHSGKTVVISIAKK